MKGPIMETAAPRLERIAIGIDFGEPSLDAARWVASQLAPDAELILVHVVDVVTWAPEGAPEPTKDDVDAAREQVAGRLREVADALGARRAVRVEIGVGRPASEVARIAEACAADLIVVGPHRGRETTVGIGSTAERLIRISPVPVLLVPAARAGAPRHLLVPVADVDLAPAVVRWADVFARHEGVILSLLHVVDPRLPRAGTRREPARRGDSSGEADAPAVDEAAEADRFLSALADGFTDRRGVSYEIASGTPAEAILAAAHGEAADLIVIGRRGRGRVMPGVVGSTASAVLRNAPCPVLVVVDPPDAILESWNTNGSITAEEPC